ncbi:hypothetical protein CBG46_05520 [Actinobacillus succinogenes]|uniref:HD domain-containing protein n=1 Tax=Actinobacillus succinogenes TaxID=67854 RepID=UPI0002EE4085|nr:hypothetical protein CBG46_05520 [Actinobacillus succinogenes]
MQGQSHCAHVLLYSVILGERLQLNEAQRDTLCTVAVFHDSQRQDDSYDTGHGGRAAVYYRRYCETHELFVDDTAVALMKYHDRNDDFGIAGIEKYLPNTAEATFLYQIFKDADGLDRFRLGEQYFDPRYLRTDAARELTEFARALVAESETVLATD